MRLDLLDAEAAQHPSGQNEVEKPFMACAHEVTLDATAKATKAGITGREPERSELRLKMMVR